MTTAKKTVVTVETISGRSIPMPPPLRTRNARMFMNDVKALYRWIIEHARAEAEWRRDEHAISLFAGAKAERLPYTSRVLMVSYLFGEADPEWDEFGQRIRDDLS